MGVAPPILVGVANPTFGGLGEDFADEEGIGQDGPHCWVVAGRKGGLKRRGRLVRDKRTAVGWAADEGLGIGPSGLGDEGRGLIAVVVD